VRRRAIPLPRRYCVRGERGSPLGRRRLEPPRFGVDCPAYPRSPRLSARTLYRPLYEAFAEQRPPGWPAAGAGALCALAAQRRAATFEGDIARLRILAKDMRAAALHADSEHVARAAERARRRADGGPRRGPGAEPRFTFRQTAPEGRPRFETPELRRLRVRDELLRVGEHPGLASARTCSAPDARPPSARRPARPRGATPVLYRLPDGMTERAQRYRRELADGRWALPDAWSEATPVEPDA
jgi:hypothetical protein